MVLCCLAVLKIKYRPEFGNIRGQKQNICLLQFVQF